MYAQSLKVALEELGHNVEVVIFGNLRRLPPVIRHALFAARIWSRIRNTDVVVAFDTYSTGVPAAVACTLRHKRLYVRIGGDFAWESYVEQTGDLLPLPRFYENKDRWRFKQRLAAYFVRYLAPRSIFLFTSDWMRAIWSQAYSLDVSRTAVVQNVMGSKVPHLESVHRNFLMFTRPIKLKNREAFRRAFEKARIRYPDIVLEEGVVPHDELIERIRSAYAVVLPSISDVTPNYILESIRCGTPFLLTKYSAYAEQYGHLGVIIDPLDPRDMERGVHELLDPSKYAAMQRSLLAYEDARSYKEVATDLVNVFRRV